MEVFGQTAAAAVPGDDRVPTQIDEDCGLRAGPGGWIWLLGLPSSPGPPAGRLARAGAENFIELAGRTGELNPGTERTAKLADRACDLLGSVLPELAPACRDRQLAGKFGHRPDNPGDQRVAEPRLPAA